MCTLIALLNEVNGFPVVVAQNRDNSSHLGELPPSEIWGRQKIFAPIDVKSEGTWIGINENGIVLALTNHYQLNRAHFNADMSRGTIVLESLKNASSYKEVLNIVKIETNRHQLRYFNLFCLSSKEAHVIQWDGKIKTFPIINKRVLHYSSSYDKGEVKSIRESRLESLFAELKSGSNIGTSLNLIEQACKDHFGLSPSAKSICMHGKERRTISSSIFALSDNGEVLCRYLYRQPCENEYITYRWTIAR